ncbi:hypothetical protein [Caproiciproducens faecalis]|uniref:ArsR family transcriptional regulator n=1 Tax=Caproiciproducens faecalis TaxID=2820301 RepID=A0ABS7DLW5_9FIRM|nr:hypothetical protein [Caproiciproducens faecalis]MBW7572305.1 hypothetical protein [Caproiciproducens faecalis]
MNRSPELLKAKSCYGHLGGTLGNRLFARLLELGWFERDGDKATVFSLTELGKQELSKLNVDIYKRS